MHCRDLWSNEMEIWLQDDQAKIWDEVAVATFRVLSSHALVKIKQRKARIRIAANTGYIRSGYFSNRSLKYVLHEINVWHVRFQFLTAAGKMFTIRTSKTSVCIHETTRRYIPESRHLLMYSILGITGLLLYPGLNIHSLRTYEAKS